MVCRWQLLGRNGTRPGLVRLFRSWQTRSTALRLYALYRRRLVYRSDRCPACALGNVPSFAEEGLYFYSAGKEVHLVLVGRLRARHTAGLWTLRSVLPTRLCAAVLLNDP